MAPGECGSVEKAPRPERDALKSFYESRYNSAYMAQHPDVNVARVRDVLLEIPTLAVTSILDYGCGRGFWTPLLHELFPEAEIIGIDISETAVQRALSEGLPGTFLSFDGRRAPFEDRMFGMVFSFHVLEHVLDLSATLDDISRLVAPGGWICLILPCGNEGSLEHNVAQRTHAIVTSPTGELRFRFEDEGHLRRLRSSDLVALLQQRGLELTSASFANHRWGALNFIMRSDGSFIRHFADPRTAEGLLDTARVTALRALLLALALIVRAHRVATVGTASTRKGRARVARVVRLLAPVLVPVVRSLEALSDREWQTRRADPRASAQYLFLRRGSPHD
jgi:SAM-dependent methyltransferase